MESLIMNITPEIAKCWLEKNERNPRTFINANVVEAYARDIASGKWILNGEPIVIDEDGYIKNGQHRLKAVVKANKAIMSNVVTGVSRDVTLWDMGYTRSVAQVTKQQNAICTVARLLLCKPTETVPKAMIMDFIEAHKQELQEAHGIATASTLNAIGRKGGVVLAVYILRKNKMATDEMLKEFFWIFNNQSVPEIQTRNPTAALIAARTFKNRAGKIAGTMTQIIHASLILQAVGDYKKNKNRKRDYVENIQETIAILEETKARIKIEEERKLKEQRCRETNQRNWAAQMHMLGYDESGNPL